jgi:hypothetical protein
MIIQVKNIVVFNLAAALPESLDNEKSFFCVLKYGIVQGSSWYLRIKIKLIRGYSQEFSEITKKDILRKGYIKRSSRAFMLHRVEKNFRGKYSSRT